MKHIFAFVLLSAGVTVSASAFAADAVVEPPVEPVVVVETPVFTWTGFYAGVQAGYLWGESEATFDAANPFDIGPDGFLGGVYAGYNYQFANGIVLGVEADFNGTTADSDRVFDDPTGDSATSELNWLGSLRARLGYGYDRFLPYITGGVAFADYDHSVTLADGSGAEYSEGYVGWTIGGGLEYAFTDNFITRLEYRYTDFGDEDYSDNGIIANHNVDLTSHQVLLGVSYKF